MNLVRASAVLAAVVLLAACTDAGLYGSGSRGAGAPDRAVFEGSLCVPPASGEAFPIKVLFAVPGGEGINPDLVGEIVNALNELTGRFGSPYEFSLVAYHTIATGLQGSFVDSAGLQAAIQRYAAYQEQGPWSLRAPLKLARSVLAGDMLTSCRGAVSRTRYLVILLLSNLDTSCDRSDLNLGLNADCYQFFQAGDPLACSRCELTKVTTDLKGLAERYGAGSVSVQPVYVHDSIDNNVNLQAQAIANAGGTALLNATSSNVSTVLNAINYTSLHRQLVLKRLVAFNRNSIARSGRLLPDSDGDGLPDEDEAARGTDPRLPDTDDDGLMDGLEVRMALDPLTPNTINGCNRYLDTDGDRLNDCEERVLGTESCMGDTDSDGLSDLVEFLSSSNPLVAEGLVDIDRDGLLNVDEVLDHSDLRSADVAFHLEHGYGYQVQDADPTPDGRSCYDIRVTNVGLVPTLSRPNPPFPDIRAGTNDLILYMQAGHTSAVDAASVGSILIRSVPFDPANKTPLAPLGVTPEEFLLGI